MVPREGFEPTILLFLKQVTLPICLRGCLLHHRTVAVSETNFATFDPV